MTPATRYGRYEAKVIAGFFAFMWLAESFAPGWNGILFETSHVTAGESRIVAAIYLVGAGLLWTR
jgi:hypothetical protein